MAFKLCLIFLVLLTSHLSAEPRNLILITIDTIRADYLSCNGSVKVQTPNLDRIAKEGVNFKRARTPVPLTLPAHASILTALNPPSHGVRDNGAFQLDDTHVTLAEILRKHGYTTAAFVGAFVLDHRFGLAQGFELYDDHTWTEASQMENMEAERNAGAVYAAFANWLEAHSRREPFFVWIHFYDPHAPYTPPSLYGNRYQRDPYAGEIAYTDAVIGKVLNDFDRRKLSQRSIVAVVGDHGEGLGEHREHTHSVLIYNSTLHVPMLISGPGVIPSGVQVDELSRTIDMAPTLLDYLQIREKLGEGISLRSLVEKKKAAGETVAYSESLYANLNLGWSELYGLETRDYHFILAPQAELYHVLSDSNEKNNRIGQSPEIARELRQKLERLKTTHGSVSPSKMDPETKEKLESLGYVSGTSVPRAANHNRVDPKDKMDLWNQIQTGIGQYSHGEIAESVKTFRSILIKERDLPVVYDSLGLAYMQMQQWSEAQNILEQALDRKLEWPGLHLKLGQIYQQLGNRKRAEEELKKAIAMDPLSVSAYYYLGNVYRSSGNLMQAVESYKRALEINPAYAYAWHALAMTYTALKREEEALQSFGEAVRSDPGAIPVYFNMATHLKRMKRYREAVESYRKFLALSAGKGFDRERQKATQAIQELESQIAH